MSSHPKHNTSTKLTARRSIAEGICQREPTGPLLREEIDQSEDIRLGGARLIRFRLRPNVLANGLIRNLYRGFDLICRAYLPTNQGLNLSRYHL